MIEHLCLGGARVSAVVGKAGTGKTYALARCARGVAGVRSSGARGRRRATRREPAPGGQRHRRAPASPRCWPTSSAPAADCPDGAVLVVDEAGHARRPAQLGELLDAVEQADGKLVLVGDHRQLQELEAGGTFRGLVRRGLAVELTRERRQREALGAATPSTSSATAIRSRRSRRYVAHDRDPHRPARRTTTRGGSWRDWRAAARDGDAVMIAQRRSDVADLNRASPRAAARSPASSAARSSPARRPVRRRRPRRHQAQRPTARRDERRTRPRARGRRRSATRSPSGSATSR